MEIRYRRETSGIGGGTSEDREPGVTVFLPLFWWQVVVIRDLVVPEQFLNGSELHILMLWGTEGVRDESRLLSPAWPRTTTIGLQTVSNGKGLGQL